MKPGPCLPPPVKTRRALVLGGAAALLAGTHAFSQTPGKTYRVAAFLTMAGLAAAPFLDALRERLAVQGFVEGRNLAIDPFYISPQGEVRAVDQSRYDAILVCTSYLTRPVLARDAGTPVVFVWVADPVGFGFVKDLARPGRRGRNLLDP